MMLYLFEERVKNIKFKGQKNDKGLEEYLKHEFRKK